MDDGSKKFRSIQHCVYITEMINKILLKDEQLKSLNIDTQLAINVEYLVKNSCNI